MPSTSAGSGERRRHVRYSFTGTFEAFEPKSQTRIQGRTADLSEGGCYVDTICPFAAQTRVRIRITREQQSFESQATVVYSVAGMGMGLQFEAIDAQQRASLRKWVRELSGEAVIETPSDQRWDSTALLSARDSVLSELVTELMRKGVLTEAMARGMLQRLASAARHWVFPPSTQ